ncbi:MAG TPA: protein kinase, partial [Pyrinomonadaceae bacterium]|nr:protein kinase [Pyrinomonadaceae bacterium]
MKTEHWAAVERLYDAALERAAEERAAFLSEACGGDEELRSEVESLLAYQDRAKDFIETPALQIAGELMANGRSLVAGQSLNHYTILELLGVGGMGEVYLAEDTRLKRRVALKLLPAELTANSDRLRRFKQEARAASALNHPNILTIYEIGQAESIYEICGADDIHYIAAELIEGITLRERMSSPIDLREMLETMVQLASGLACAHEARIVHRDIKPENIMIRRDGYAKLVDFGLAKLTDYQISPDPEAETMAQVNTEPGMIVGTVMYMSPEQVRGLEVDERSDVWSLGVVIYEIVAGEHPFAAPTQSDVLASILQTEPSPLKHFSPNAPAELQRIVKKALHKNRVDRYVNAKEFAVDLMNLLRNLEDSERAVEQEASSIAILPFRNITNDPSVSFYEFSLADAVITELLRLRSLVVRPSSAIAKYVGHENDPMSAGRELQVNAVLSASFLHSNSRIRVTAQLLDAEKGTVLWADRIDSETGDIITVQDIITQRIVEGLQLNLAVGEDIDLAGHATRNAAAYEEYLRGRDRLGQYAYHTVRGKDIEAAVRHFNRATELDSKFALAYCGLGACYVQTILTGFGKRRDLLLAREAFDKGLAIDPEIVEARVYMLFVYLMEGAKEHALAEIDVIRRESPNNAWVHYVSGVLYRLSGEYDKALESYDRALRLNPAESVKTGWGRARILMYQGRYDEALLDLDKAAAIEPDHLLLKAIRAEVLFFRGDAEVACKLLEEVLRQHPNMDGVRPLYAQVLSGLGEHAAARAQLSERVKEVALLDHDISYWLACAYAMEGEADNAIYWLKQAITCGNENIPWFKSNPA